MKLFNKPKWLKPEINELKYWFHLVIVAAVAIFLIDYFLKTDMFSIKTVLMSVPFLGAGDIIAHTLLKFD